MHLKREPNQKLWGCHGNDNKMRLKTVDARREDVHLNSRDFMKFLKFRVSQNANQRMSEFDGSRSTEEQLNPMKAHEKVTKKDSQSYLALNQEWKGVHSLV